MTQANTTTISITKEMHHPFFDLYKRSDDIVVWVTFDKWFTIKEARDFVHAMHSITGGTPHLLLVIAGKKSSIDKDGRSYLASDEAMKDIKAMGAVINGATLRVIANMFLVVDKPVKPVRFFDNSKEAIEWLKHQGPTS